MAATPRRNASANDADPDQGTETETGVIDVTEIATGTETATEIGVTEATETVTEETATATATEETVIATEETGIETVTERSAEVAAGRDAGAIGHAVGAKASPSLR